MVGWIPVDGAATAISELILLPPPSPDPKIPSTVAEQTEVWYKVYSFVHPHRLRDYAPKHYNVLVIIVC